MENTVYSCKNESCQNFRIGHPIHLQWLRMNEKRNGEVRRENRRGGGREEGGEKKPLGQTGPKTGWPLPRPQSPTPHTTSLPLNEKQGSTASF